MNSGIARERQVAALWGVVAAGILLGAEPVQAQSAGELEEVVVTGSRIVRRDFEANSPITTVEAARLEETGNVSIESVLNQLPHFVPAVNQFNTGELFAGATRTPGVPTLSLRGLGPNRNLVLIDGRRGMPVDATMAVNIDTIPAAAVERIETITGGASSVYGADAVAGVVNFVLKRNFEGIDISAQYGQTAEGDAGQGRFSMLFGTNSGDGSTNMMLGLDITDRDELREADRDFYLDGWADSYSDTGNSFWGAAGISAQATNPFSQAVVNQTFAGAPGPVSRTGTFYLNSDGTLYKTDSSGSYRYNGPFLNQEGVTFRYLDAADNSLGEMRVTNLAQSPLRRYSLFSRVRTDLTDNLTAFAHGTFSESSLKNTASVNDAAPPWGSFGAPALGGWRSSAPHGDGIYASSVDANGNTRPEYRPGGALGLNCPPVGGCTKSQAFPVSPEVALLLDSRPNPEADFEFVGVSWWAGQRRSFIDTTSYQLTAGLEGSFPANDWTWEAFATKGTTRTMIEYGGQMSLERWRFVTGQPNYGRSLFHTGNTLGAGFAAGTITCESGMPAVYGVSGYDEAFVPSADCQRAVGAVLKSTGLMEQTQVEFNLQGGIVELPAGDLRFAVGTSYRENHYEYLADTLNSNEAVIESTAGAFPAGSSVGTTDTAEIYGELLVPLLADKPGIRHLNLELGYRDSSNDPSSDTTSYKALLDWGISDRVRLRGGRQIANRAPNIGELFQAPELRTAGSSRGDWCSDLNPVNALSPNPSLNPNHAQARALCEAIMGPGAAEVFYSNPSRHSGASQTRTGQLRGNPNLNSEEAETFTFGIVTEVAEGVRLTLDYWEIEVADMIAAQHGDVIYTQCMSPETNPTFDPNHPACQQVVRDPFTGESANLFVSFSNQSALNAAGYDVQLDWSRDVGPGVLSVNFLGSFLDEISTRVDPDASWTDWKGTTGPADVTGVQGWSYDYKAFTTVGFQRDRWSVNMRWRYLPEIMPDENRVNALSTLEPTNPYSIVDLSGRFDVGDTVQLRYGIENLFDTDPELTFPDPARPDTATGQTNRSFYDILGRRYYIGFAMHL